MRVGGLVAAAQHNGIAGVIRSTLNTATARIDVTLDNGCGVSIKPASLTLLSPAAGLTIRGVAFTDVANSLVLGLLRSMSELTTQFFGTGRDVAHFDSARHSLA